MLRNKFQSVFLGDCTAVPIHKRSVKLDDFAAIVEDNMSLKRSRSACAFVVFEIASDIELADNPAGNECGNGSVNRSTGNGWVAFPCGDEQFLCRKMPRRFVRGGPNCAALLRVTQSVRGEEAGKIGELQIFVGRGLGGGIHTEEMNRAKESPARKKKWNFRCPRAGFAAKFTQRCPLSPA